MTNVKFINTQELFALSQSNKSFIIIDTRSEETYLKEHIPNAINMPEIFSYLSTSTNEGFDHLNKTFTELFGKAGLTGKEQVVFYDEALNTDFGRACRGAFLLHYFKYPRILILNGSFQIWKELGLPVEKRFLKVNAHISMNNKINKGLMVDAVELFRSLSDSCIVTLDVRDINEWIGEVASPSSQEDGLRKGRIPGARWIEWRRFMKLGQFGYIFKSPKEVLAECHSAGIVQTDTIYIYCYKGSRAALVYFILIHAGFKNVHVYFSSWYEWAQCLNMPVEQKLSKALGRSS